MIPKSLVVVIHYFNWMYDMVKIVVHDGEGWGQKAPLVVSGGLGCMIEFEGGWSYWCMVEFGKEWRWKKLGSVVLGRQWMVAVMVDEG